MKVDIDTLQDLIDMIDENLPSLGEIDGIEHFYQSAIELNLAYQLIDAIDAEINNTAGDSSDSIIIIRQFMEEFKHERDN